MTLPSDSSSSPPPKLAEAIAQFNRREFFACHETLEQLWLPASGQIREFYQGVIQIAAGLHHVQRGNYAGAATLLRRGRARLKPFGPAPFGLHLAELVAGVDRCLGELRALAAGERRGFDQALIPTVSWGRFGSTESGPQSPEATNSG